MYQMERCFPLESARLVPFLLGTNFPPWFKMADLMSFLCVSECFKDFEFINDLVEEDDDVILFSAVSCITWRNLTAFRTILKLLFRDT